MEIGKEYDGIVITFFADGRNYGWIKCHAIDTDCFFHLDKVISEIYPKLGMKCKFILKYDKCYIKLKREQHWD